MLRVPVIIGCSVVGRQTLLTLSCISFSFYCFVSEKRKCSLMRLSSTGNTFQAFVPGFYSSPVSLDFPIKWLMQIVLLGSSWMFFANVLSDDFALRSIMIKSNGFCFLYNLAWSSFFLAPCVWTCEKSSVTCLLASLTDKAFSHHESQNLTGFLICVNQRLSAAVMVPFSFHYKKLLTQLLHVTSYS